MERTYTINLTCGCSISLDGGGALMPCDYEPNTKCRFQQEYVQNPKYDAWQIEIEYRNGNMSERKYKSELKKLVG